MKADQFVHLHVHSHYSLLDGLGTVDELVSAAKSNHMSSLALTDHGNLFGAIEFYKAAMAGGVKPIIGYEAYVAPGSRLERDMAGGKDAAFHLILLCENERGYKNLMKLASMAYLEGFYYKPRIDKELLSNHAQGLIALSACLKSEVAAALSRDDMKVAERVAGEYRDIMGAGNFYLEVQREGVEGQEAVVAASVELGRRVGIPLVATNDIHYVRREDARVHDVLLCINTGKLLDDQDRMRFATDEFYFRSPAEMAEIFRDMPDVLARTAEIAGRCNVEMDFGRRHYPPFETPHGESPSAFLRQLAEQGLTDRYRELDERIRKRLDYELETIERVGDVPYFLFVWDMVRYAKERGIAVGPGRGSAAGSLVSYCLKISDIDPIKYDLLFERFTDPERAEAPDFDIDFSESRRNEVVDYVRQKYGPECVAPIITFGTMAARAAIRDVGRVMNIPLAAVDRLAKRVPLTVGITLDEALARDAELAAMYSSEPWVKDVIDVARRMEGRARHASKHACAIVVADKPLVEYLPLYRADGDVTTQFAREYCDDIGVLKVDVLSLRTLAIIDMTLDLVARHRGERLALSSVPLDDDAVYQSLARGETKGVFQLESQGFRDLLVRIKPTRFEDLIPIVGLYRPGPLGSGVTEDFIRRKSNPGEVSYPHPILEPILKETYGSIVYQEQIMRILNAVGNIPLRRTYTIVKAISKKRSDVIDAAREEFTRGGRAHGLSEETAAEIFDVISYFGSYGFNKSHSAAYSLITYLTAYLKVRYPLEFMAALMTCEAGDTEKVPSYMEECRRMGIEVQPPSVNESEAGFAVSEGQIRCGLGVIRNVGSRAIETILSARAAGGPFSSIYDFCERADPRLVSRQALESLIKSGAMDCLGGDRARLMAGLETALQAGSASQRDRQAGQMSLFGSVAAEGGSSGPETLPEVPAWSEPVRLQHEKEALGFYITSHPLAKHESLLRRFSSASTSMLPAMEDGEEITLGCMVVSIAPTYVRSGRNQGQKMAQLVLEDFEGTCRAIMFSSVYAQYGESLRADQVVFVKGQVDRRREEPGIRISSIIPLENAEAELADRVVISVKSEGADEKTLGEMREVMLRHPGRCRVLLEVSDASGTRSLVETGAGFRVNCSSAFRREIEALLGHGCLRLEVSRARPTNAARTGGQHQP